VLKVRRPLHLHIYIIFSPLGSLTVFHSNYHCDDYWGCTSSLEGKLTITAAVDKSVVHTPTTFTLSDTYNLYGYPLSTAMAKPIQIRFRSSDLSILSSLPTLLTSEASWPSGTSYPTHTTDMPTIRTSNTGGPDSSSAKKSSSGLSQSDKIQVAMGITFPVIAILVAIYGIWRVRNARATGV
jgi:hypothetical protein